MAAGFQDEKEPQSQGMWVISEAGKGEEMHFHVEPPELP